MKVLDPPILDSFSVGTKPPRKSNDEQYLPHLHEKFPEECHPCLGPPNRPLLGFAENGSIGRLHSIVDVLLPLFLVNEMELR